MVSSANTFTSMNPIFKESYPGSKKDKKKKKSRFEKLRAKFKKD